MKKRRKYNIKFDRTARLEYVNSYFTHELIEELTKKFLDNGGKIIKLPPDPRLNKHRKEKSNGSTNN